MLIGTRQGRKMSDSTTGVHSVWASKRLIVNIIATNRW